MDKIYIMSQYRAATEKEQEFNRNVARHFAKQIAYEGNVPVAPHLFYTQFLDDGIPDERERGLNFGLFDLRNSQEYLLIIIDGVISDGMKAELAEASRIGLPGRVIAMSRQQVSEAMKVVV